jgi:hypothetical protein
MCPRGLALRHPAAGALLEYATGGCPVNTGKNWTAEMVKTAVQRGAHVSALVSEAMEQLLTEALEKEKKGQCKIVDYEELNRKGLPPQLKISRIAMIPHKSRLFRAILNLSFRIKLQDGSYIPSINETTTLEAPAGAIDQMGHELDRVIHAFAEADMRMQKFSWTSKTLRIVFGVWTANLMKSGILLMCCRRNLTNLYNWWYLSRCRWGGSNLHHISVRHRKLPNTLRQRWGLSQNTSSLIMQWLV